MSAFRTTEAAGACAAGCGWPIEAGELVVMVNDQLVHLECENPEREIAAAAVDLAEDLDEVTLLARIRDALSVRDVARAHGITPNDDTLAVLTKRLIARLDVPRSEVVDAAGIQERVRAWKAAIGPGGDKSWAAAQLARDVEPLLRAVRRLEHYRAAAIAAVRAGTGHDLNPTAHVTDGPPRTGGWVGYIQELDETWRVRLLSALGASCPERREGHVFLDDVCSFCGEDAG